MSSPLTPSARTIDPRGQRFGAGVSVAILVVAFVLEIPLLAALVGLFRRAERLTDVTVAGGRLDFTSK